MSSIKIARFGEKLHRLRTGAGMTLKGLAQALGHSSHSYLSELEAGKKIPTAEFVLAVALLFDVSTDSLLRDDLDIPENQSAGRERNVSTIR